MPATGTSPASIDLAEDRERFNELCTRLGIPQPDGDTAASPADARAVAERVGYPVLVRPSYVLGGRAMQIVYGAAGLDDSKDTIALCRIGERSSHTWFVLKELLGHDNVKNYDGSWTEYGSLVGVPIALGDEPGTADA